MKEATRYHDFNSAVDTERKTLLSGQKQKVSDVTLDALEEREAVKHADRLISGINLAFDNKEEFELLLGILNSTGEYLRKLINKEKHKVEESTRQIIWNKINNELELNNKRRDKLRMMLAILKKLNTKLSENPPPGTYLNDIVHANIGIALRIFDLKNRWFAGEKWTSCSNKEQYIFAFGTSISLLDQYINYKIFRDKMAYWLGLLIGFGTGSGVGVGAYFGCTKMLLGKSASLATAVTVGGVPAAVIAAGLALAIITFVLIYAIGKTADHRKWGLYIGALIALGILITFCMLPFLIHFHLPVLTIFSQMGIWTLTIITFSVNYLIYSAVSPRFTTRVLRGETFKKDNGKEMTWKKYLTMWFFLFLSVLLGFSVGTLFLVLSKAYLHVSFLSVLGILACIGAFLGYFLIVFANILSAARAPNGLKGALIKLFEPAFKTFEGYGKYEKPFAWFITAILCGGIIYGATHLGMAQAISLKSLLVSAHMSPHTALILGHVMGTGITTTLLLPFYIGAAIICVGLLFQYFKSRKLQNNEKKGSTRDLSDKIKGREVVFWKKNDASKDFSKLQNEVVGALAEKESKNDDPTKSQPEKKDIIITHWQESSFIIFIEINDVMIKIIVSEGKDEDKESKFYKAIIDYENEESSDNKNNLIDFIYEFCISKDRVWVIDIVSGAVKSYLFVPFNAFVNASFVPGGGIQEISSNPLFVYSGTVCQGGCSTAAGLAGGRLASQSEYRNEIVNDIIKELFPDLPSQVHRSSSESGSNYSDTLKKSGSPVIGSRSIDRTKSFSRDHDIDVSPDPLVI